MTIGTLIEHNGNCFFHDYREEDSIERQPLERSQGKKSPRIMKLKQSENKLQIITLCWAAQSLHEKTFPPTESECK